MSKGSPIPETTAPLPGAPGPGAGGDAAARRPRRISRRLRWAVRVVVMTPLLLAIFGLLLARSPLVGGTVKGMIKDATGADLHAAAIFVGIDGRLILERPSLRVPGMADEAGEVLSAHRAVIDLDWSRWRTGNVVPLSLRMERPVFRVSQSLDDQSVNLAGLTSAAMKKGGGGVAGGGVGGRPPQVDIMDGRIEFADHSDLRGTFEIHHTIQVAGSLVPIDPTAGLYTLRLQEIGRAPPVTPGPRGMILDGKIDLRNDDYALRLLNLPLEGFPPDAIPSAYRETWRRLNFRGRVHESTMGYTPKDGLRLDLGLQGVSLDVPIQSFAKPSVASGAADETVSASESAVGAASLTISEVTGMISLAKAGLTVDLTGLLEDQTTPSRVRLQTQGLELDSALRCEITGRRLSVEKNPSFFPYVPDKVREYFTAFSGPTADFDARVVITRDGPVDGKPSPIRIADGRMVFRNGTAAFHKFPYHFHDMSGSVEFNENRLKFTDLHGFGPTGAEMTATALIEPLTDEASVRVNVSSRKTPVDAHLLAAMPPGDRRVMETLFAFERYREMVDRGLVISSEARAWLERDLDDLRGLLSDAMGQPEMYGAEIEQLRRALERAEPRLEIPIFDLAGNANVEVTVSSPIGRDAPWFVDVDVAFPTAGLLPEPFPYPIVGTNFRLKVSPEKAELVTGEFVGVNGGVARLSAEVILEEAGVRCVKPDIRIFAWDIPVDDLLISAVPDTSGDSPVDPMDAAFVGPPRRPLSAQIICQTLDVRGTINAAAVITPDPDASAAEPSAFVSDLVPVEPTTPSDPVTYDVLVVLDNLTAGPQFSDESTAIRLANLRGSMRVSPERIVVENLGAELLRGTASTVAAGDAAGQLPLARLNVNLRAGLEGDDELPAGTVRADVRATEIDLGAPLEQFVAIFNDEAGSFLTNVRGELSPTGRLDVAIRIEHDEPVLGADGPVSARDLREFAFSNVRAVELKVPELAMSGQSTADATTSEPIGGARSTGSSGRIRLDCPSGTFRLVDETRPGDPGSDRLNISFNDLVTDISFEGDPAGTVRADGAFTIAGEKGVLVRPAAVTATVRSARLESTLIKRIVETTLSKESGEKFRELDFKGTFDADVNVTGLEGRTDELAQVVGVVTPRSLTFFDGTDRVELPPVAGSLSVRAAQTGVTNSWQAAGQFRGIELQASDLSALIEGEWSYGREMGARVDAKLDVKSESLTERHTTLMPGAVRRALESLDVKLTGPWSLSPGRLVIESGVKAEEGPAGAAVRKAVPGLTTFEGQLAFSEGSLDVGVPVTDASGRVEIRARSREDEQSPEFDLRIRSADFRVAGAMVTDASALISSASGSDRVEIPYATAACHGGRVWGSGEILSSPERKGQDGRSATAGARYKADVVAAGVAFAPLMDELTKQSAADGLAVTDAGEDVVRDPRVPPDQSRGLLDARLSLQGVAGDVSSRVGRGSVRIASGSVLRLPLVFPLMQLSNFALPMGDQLDYLQAGFHLEGGTASFEQIALLSDSIAILGSGTMTFPTMELDMTFNSRGTNRIPLLSDVFELLRNEIVTTRVTGRIEDPSIQSQPLVGTRRAIDRLFNSESLGMDPMSAEAFKSVWRERERYRALLDPAARSADPVIAPTPLPPVPPLETRWDAVQAPDVQP